MSLHNSASKQQHSSLGDDARKQPREGNPDDVQSSSERRDNPRRRHGAGRLRAPDLNKSPWWQRVVAMMLRMMDLWPLNGTGRREPNDYTRYSFQFRQQPVVDDNITVTGCLLCGAEYPGGGWLLVVSAVKCILFSCSTPEQATAAGTTCYLFTFSWPHYKEAFWLILLHRPPPSRCRNRDGLIFKQFTQSVVALSREMKSVKISNWCTPVEPPLLSGIKGGGGASIDFFSSSHRQNVKYKWYYYVRSYLEAAAEDKHCPNHHQPARRKGEEKGKSMKMIRLWWGGVWPGIHTVFDWHFDWSKRTPSLCFVFRGPGNIKSIAARLQLFIRSYQAHMAPARPRLKPISILSQCKTFNCSSIHRPSSSPWEGGQIILLFSSRHHLLRVPSLSLFYLSSSFARLKNVDKEFTKSNRATRTRTTKDADVLSELIQYLFMKIPIRILSPAMDQFQCKWNLPMPLRPLRLSPMRSKRQWSDFHNYERPLTQFPIEAVQTLYPAPVCGSIPIAQRLCSWKRDRWEGASDTTTVGVP